SDTAAPEPTAKPVVKKIAAAKTEVVNDAASAYAPVTAPTGANGYVAVLASVPRSDSSRMTALKRFADMQQKYGSVLNGKTPDVAEANLGAKGAYHRLVVGPPASRQQASTLCSELKAQGYADCWVTAY
ncbi:MAG TPA: SPOR domain-containing protein, partial [Hyphomicrobium sp.]|nr:SPOR domain-containing protein [Hyphomicrobium sp.]